MSNYTEYAEMMQQKEDFAPTKETLVEVLMQTGLVTKRQAEGIAANAITIDKAMRSDREG